MKKILYLLAGANGGGKTTFYYRYLQPQGISFVNADEIVRDHFPITDVDRDRKGQEAAFKLFDDYLERGETFCYETVFSHESKLDFLKRANAKGFEVRLTYITLKSPELHLERVQKRVSEGGHDVPKDKILSRLKRIPGLMEEAFKIADIAVELDNSGVDYIEVRRVQNV